MRITRLHLLLLSFALIGAGYEGFVWWHRQRSAPEPRIFPKPDISPAPVSPPAAEEPAVSGQACARTLAIVGEAYRALAEQSGNIPAIAVPLRSAKAAQAAGHYARAMVSAKEAWEAVKRYRKTAASGAYTVVKGDTLWAIARDHSPVRQGPAWVVIWRANQRLVKDFDRIETGWRLRIPLKRSMYITRYWKPRAPVSAKAAAPAIREKPKKQETPAPIQLAAPLPETPASLQQAWLKSPLSPALPPVYYH